MLRYMQFLVGSAKSIGIVEAKNLGRDMGFLVAIGDHYENCRASMKDFNDIGEQRAVLVGQAGQLARRLVVN